MVRRTPEERWGGQNIPVLGRSSGHTHGSVAAVNTLHLHKSTLLVIFIAESDESISAALTRHGVRHDFGALARRETSLEERHQDVFIDLGAKVADKDGVLGATILSDIGQSTLLFNAGYFLVAKYGLVWLFLGTRNGWFKSPSAAIGQGKGNLVSREQLALELRVDGVTFRATTIV